jgi:hypothetical protein
MGRDLVDIWQDDYDDRVEGRGIYREYVEPDVEPDYDAMENTMADLVLTADELNHQHQVQLKRMQELADAINHWRYLTRGNKR